MYFLLFFLGCFPIPLWGFPTNNIFFFFALVFSFAFSSLRHSRVPRYFYSLFLLILLIFIFILSSSLPFDSNTLFLYLRYVVAVSPLLAFNILLKTFTKYRYIFSLYSFYVLSLLVLGLFSLFPFCFTAYGGFCIFFQRSSSFGSVVCPLVVFQLTSIILSSIKLNHSLRIFSVLTIILYIFLGLSLGARLYFVLLLVAMASLILYYILRGFPSLSKFRVSSKLRTAIVVLSSSLLISTSLILYFSDFFISLYRLISFFKSPFQDYRFSSGLLFSSRSDQSLLQFLFGNQIFSELPTWNSTSVYDSTVNLLLSDFGLIGALLLLLILSLSLYPPLMFLKQYNYAHFIFTSSILLYVIASFTNEFLLLKALNPFFVITTSLVTSFAIADSLSTDP